LYDKEVRSDVEKMDDAGVCDKEEDNHSELNLREKLELAPDAGTHRQNQQTSPETPLMLISHIIKSCPMVRGNVSTS